MKYLLVISAVLVVAYGLDKEFVDKFKEKVMKVGEECMGEVGATSDDIEEIVEARVPSSHAGKCLLACGHKKFNIQGADGKIDLPGAIAELDPLKEADIEVYGKMKAMMEKCGAEVSNDADECITAVNWMECIHRESKLNGIENIFKM